MNLMMISLVFVLTILHIDGGSAQVVSLGACPTATAIPNLNVTKYGGVWYEYSRFFTFFEIASSCVNATYTPNSDGTVVVLNQAKQLITGKVSTTGSARQASPPSGALIVSFGNTPSSSTANYLILATDYSSYAVVWSCASLAVANLQFAWILTRKQVPDQSTIDTALAVFDSKGINRKRLRKTSQSNCN